MMCGRSDSGSGDQAQPQSAALLQSGGSPGSSSSSVHINGGGANGVDDVKFRLIYFDVKGRAECARMLFALARVPFEDVRLDGAQWMHFKEATPFGQLPVLEIGGGKMVLCQSRAIDRYLAKELGFFGDTNLEAAKIDMILECIKDSMEGISSAMSETDDGKRAEILSDYGSTQRVGGLSHFKNFLRKQLQTPWFLGEKISLADVAVYNAVHYIATFIPGALDDSVALQEWQALFETQPQIADWLKRRPQGKY